MQDLSWEEFSKVDIRVGTIVQAQVFEGARKPAYQLWIDFGPLGERKSSAQITALYTPEQLVGQQILAVLNFPKKQIGKWMSECLVLGLVHEDPSIVTLIQPQGPVPNGLRLG